MAKQKKCPTEKVLSSGQWKKRVRPHGELHGPKTLFIRGQAGEATANIRGRTEEFELSCAGMGGPGSPMVRCLRTGVWFTLSWNDILKMAIDAGICASQPEMKGK